MAPHQRSRKLFYLEVTNGLSWVAKERDVVDVVGVGVVGVGVVAESDRPVKIQGKELF